MDGMSGAQLLGLSRKEEQVILALQENYHTPVLIARFTKVSRPGVYNILASLKKRGIVETHFHKGNRSWRISQERKLEDKFYQAKRALLQIPEGRQEIYGKDDAAVVVYREKAAIRKLMSKIIFEHKHERLLGSQGNVSIIGWDKIFTTLETNKFNQSIKENEIIVEAILPENWFEKQSADLGLEWARTFEGRATQVKVIKASYFTHGGQMMIFKDSLYLFALNEELVIEIRNSEIQRMILSFFRFVQDNTPTIDANALLRDVISGLENRGVVKKQ